VVEGGADGDPVVDELGDALPLPLGVTEGAAVDVESPLGEGVELTAHSE